jgi:DNA-binding XRE family transcriptional regulator
MLLADTLPQPATPNYKNPHPLVISLRLSLHPDRTLGERVKEWRLEHGLFQVDLAKRIGVSEMTIVSWEKASIENAIGLIRRLFPKKTDFDLVTKEEVKRVETLFNTSPRKCFNYQTPNEVLGHVLHSAVECSLLILSDD